ncbi:MAG: sulfatase-like hydrolase/transferase [Kofleriaceae bacterium]
MWSKLRSAGSLPAVLWPIAQWLAPTVVAACVGAIATGIVESWGHDAYRVCVTTGLVAILALPALIAAGVIVRLIVAGWQPREAIAALVEPDGGAPVLAGWVATIWLAAFGLAWAMFQGTWLLASWTAFKPLPMGFLEPLLAVTAVVLAIALSRPAAMAIAWLARKLVPRRWQHVVLHPRTIAAGTAVVTIVACWLIWVFVARKRLAAVVELGFLRAPLAGALATVIAQLAWRGPARIRLAIGALIAIATTASIVIALRAVSTDPVLALAIWADEPLARRGIDRAFEVEEIRADVPIERFRLKESTTAHPDIVLVTIDGLRADRTPAYGGTAQMPALRELGQRGTVFEFAFAPSNVGRRSLPSTITGLFTSRLRGELSGWAFQLDPRHVVLAERLRAGGYETAAFACCREYFGSDAHTGWTRGLEHLEIESDGLALARQARRWLDAREQVPGRRPVFVWLHIREPLDWQKGFAPNVESERRRLYDLALVKTDAVLVELLAAFAQRAPERAPITIVTSAHGQGLGDHGQTNHATDLYNSQIRVPLVIAGPGIKPQLAAETASLVDLSSTILDLAGFVPPRSPLADGRSLADLATGKRLADQVGTAYATMPGERRDDSDVMAIVRGTWKLIDNGQSVELYDLRADPDERFNMFGQRPQIVAELRSILAQRARAAQVPPF